jgi:hypothetical protein
MICHGPWMITLMLLNAKGEKVIISNPSRGQQQMPKDSDQPQRRDGNDSRIHPYRK